MNDFKAFYSPVSRSERKARRVAAFAPTSSGVRVFGASYSRFVGTMKIFLPLGAAAIAVLVLVWPGYESNESEIALTFAKSGAEEEIPGMANARYVGINKNNQPFLVTASQAIQNKKNPDIIEMVTLQADMTLDNGRWMSVMASNGNYDRGRQVLKLEGPVNIFSDIGYEFHSDTVQVDLNSNTAKSVLPVQGHGPFGLLRADSFIVMDQGKRLVFYNNVRMTIQPEGGSSK